MVSYTIVFLKLPSLYSKIDTNGYLSIWKIQQMRILPDIKMTIINMFLQITFEFGTMSTVRTLKLWFFATLKFLMSPQSVLMKI